MIDLSLSSGDTCKTHAKKRWSKFNKKTKIQLQFTLETSPVKSADPTAAIPKFVQISVPSTFCTGVNKDVHGGAATACLKCKENQPKERDGTDELQALINELSLDQINGAIENST